MSVKKRNDSNTGDTTMKTRTQVIEAIAATIQTRNEEAARLNGAEFNPATRSAEYHAQQRRVDDFQARHAELVALLHELPEEGYEVSATDVDNPDALTVRWFDTEEEARDWATRQQSQFGKVVTVKQL
jgi:spore germination protein GerM